MIDLALATSGQWRMRGGGLEPMRPIALDMPAVDTAARWLEITPTRTLYRDLRDIEAEALTIMMEDRE